MSLPIRKLLAAGALIAAVLPSVASARTDVSIGVNLGGYGYPAPVYYAPPPPVYYAPAPPVVYYPSAPHVSVGFNGYYGNRWQGRDWCPPRDYGHGHRGHGRGHHHGHHD